VESLAVYPSPRPSPARGEGGAAARDRSSWLLRDFVARIDGDRFVVLVVRLDVHIPR
jgi:hypothetical protein